VIKKSRWELQSGFGPKMPNHKLQTSLTAIGIDIGLKRYAYPRYLIVGPALAVNIKCNGLKVFAPRLKRKF
jgi:hypothetical protein